MNSRCEPLVQVHHLILDEGDHRQSAAERERADGQEEGSDVEEPARAGGKRQRPHRGEPEMEHGRAGDDRAKGERTFCAGMEQQHAERARADEYRGRAEFYRTAVIVFIVTDDEFF